MGNNFEHGGDPEQRKRSHHLIRWAISWFFTKHLHCKEMSIDIHEACQALRDVQAIIDPEEDYLTIVAAEESIATADAERRKELEEAHASLRALSKVLEAARISSIRTASVPSAESHAMTMNELDSSRLSLAKSISDTETLLVRQESELAALKEDSRKQEIFDPAIDHQGELDGTILRLQIFYGLGFEPIAGNTSEVTKMLIKSSSNIHIVETTRVESSFDQTQLLWNLGSS